MTRQADWLLSVILALVVGALVVLLLVDKGPREAAVVHVLPRPAERGRDQPLVFVGGVPRSGATLMRAMLDAHRDLSCRLDTRIVPAFLQMHPHWIRNMGERLEKAGITKAVLDRAVAAFCLEVMSQSDPVPRLCYKDPIMLRSGTYVNELFPNSKFIFMLRDGRAVVHSIISRKVEISGFDWSSYRQSIKKWDQDVKLMYSQCNILGPDKCLLVRYESLVLRAEETLRRVAAFLELPWHDAMLHHEWYINQPNGVALSNEEKSEGQVVRPVNRDALDKWVGQIPADVRADMADLAPMLSVLGYDPWANPPLYDTLPAHLPLKLL